jgi:hypothetical protein
MVFLKKLKLVRYLRKIWLKILTPYQINSIQEYLAIILE